MIRQVYPALIIISSMFTGTIHYYISIWYLNKKDFNFESFLPVRFWHFPRWLVSLGIVVTLIFQTNIFFNNLNIILFFLAFIQGLAVGLFYINGRKGSKILRTIYIICIFVVPLLPLLLILLGLIDMWFNLRKLEDF
mgnify:CR=1 FL=1